MSAVPVTIVGVLTHSDGTTENVTLVGLGTLQPLTIWGPSDPRPSPPISGIPGFPGYEPPPGFYPGTPPDRPRPTPPVPGWPDYPGTPGPPGSPGWGGGPDSPPVVPAPPGWQWKYDEEYGWVLVPPGGGGKPQPIP